MEDDQWRTFLTTSMHFLNQDLFSFGGGAAGVTVVGTTIVTAAVTSVVAAVVTTVLTAVGAVGTRPGSWSLMKTC